MLFSIAPSQNGTLKKHEVDLLKPGAALYSFIYPGQNPDLVDRSLNPRLNLDNLTIID